MKAITNREYAEWQRYQYEKQNRKESLYHEH